MSPWLLIILVWIAVDAFLLAAFMSAGAFLHWRDKRRRDYLRLDREWDEVEGSVSDLRAGGPHGAGSSAGVALSPGEWPYSQEGR